MRTTHQLGETGQRGMVLAVALILLVILTVVGIAAMQSGVLQERMAVNQVQAHGTFLDSEQRVWDSAACIRAQYWDETKDELRADRPTKEQVQSNCGQGGPDLRAGAEGANVVWTPDPDDPSKSYYEVSAEESTFNTGAVTPIALRIYVPGTTLGEGFPGFPRLSPYVCFGEKCEITRASGRSSPTSDGFNRLSPNFEDNANCGARGSNRPVVDDESDFAVPGLIMPDGEINGSLSEGTDPDATPAPDVITSEDQDAIINDPSYYVNEPLAYTDDAGNTTVFGDDYKGYVDRLIGSVLDTVTNADGTFKTGVKTGSRQLEGYETGVFIAKAGETITLSSGSDAAAGGVIILDGGTLDVTGNQCFAGVVLYRNSGIITSARGTSAFLGTVIGYSGYSESILGDDSLGLTDEDARVMDPRLNGTPSFYFSDQAILTAEEVVANFEGGKYFEMLEWHLPVRRLQ